ncbi:hypothetical protein BC835DRAFT_1419737 [Cytidiella melzeri]|nr:hypothetical protein BC835DRAFT_1419737 [Cytidiella melzeri]
MPLPSLDVLDDNDNERHPQELDPTSDEEAARIEASLNNPRSPLARTRAFSKHLSTLDDATIATKMVDIIDYMASLQMDTATFLHYLSWNLDIPGHMTREQSVIRYARTALMHCEQLPGILKHWHKPPRLHKQGISTRGARDTMDRWALDNSPPEHMSEENLLGTSLKDDIVKMKALMPTYWELMHALACTPIQLKRNTYKDHEPRIFIIGAMLQYSRSQKRCLYQKVLSIYLKACGLAAKANDTTHLFGFTMSQKWVYIDIVRYIIFGGHDNLNLAFKVYEMRANHKSHFDSGTAATIYIIRDPNATPPDRLTYMQKRAIGCRNPITALDIFKHEAAAASRLCENAVFFIKRVLLMHPSFATWEYRDHPLFLRPPSVQQLPTGREHATVQFMLDTVHMEEASQDGNRKVLQEWLHQLQLDGEAARQSKRLLVWIGDQLTVIRIRCLKKDRSFDMNFVQRFEQIFEIFGWFHAQIAEESSIHKQYLGTSDSFGLKHAFENMKRKGLNSTSVQGNFHYSFRDALKHIAEARFRDLWAVVGNTADLAELQTQTPQALDAIAQKIFEDYASTAALEVLRARPCAQQDDLLDTSVQFCRDLLNYLDLDDTMKTGDVGRMELLLPRLLFRFHGGGSHNYAHEMLELMQGLWREWPDDLKSFVIRYCWLANTTGHKNGFLAFDMVQEHNIRDIKVIFAVHGPYATWEYIKKISAAIPTLCKVKDHIEKDFNHFRRGKSHTSPDHDVVNLQGKYHDGKAHIYKPGRHLTSDEKVKDFFALGCNPDTLQAMIKRWAEGRVTEKSTDENFESVETILQRLEELRVERESCSRLPADELMDVELST